MVPIKIVSCWSDLGEAVGGVFGIFVRFAVLWDGTGLKNCTGINNRIDKSIASCSNTGALRVVVFRSDINDGTGVT